MAFFYFVGQSYGLSGRVLHPANGFADLGVLRCCVDCVTYATVNDS